MTVSSLQVKERVLCCAEMHFVVAFCRKVSGMCFGYQAGSKLWCECGKTCPVDVYYRTASSLAFSMHMRESGGYVANCLACCFYCIVGAVSV